MIASKKIYISAKGFPNQVEVVFVRGCLFVSNVKEISVKSNAAISAYGQIHVNTGVQDASSHRLIQMLYEGLLTRIAQAKGAMRQKDVENKGRKITEAMNIVAGLRDFLDLERGGEVAANLDSLYDYIQRTLMQAHTRNDPAKLEECSGLIQEVSGAWKQIA